MTVPTGLPALKPLILRYSDLNSRLHSDNTVSPTDTCGISYDTT